MLWPYLMCLVLCRDVDVYDEMMVVEGGVSEI